MVLISRLICDTETPTSAGPMRMRMRLTPGSAQAARQLSEGRGSMAMRRSAGIWIASCRTPPRKTAQASARTGGSKYGTANSAMAMKERLSSTGVNAGTREAAPWY
jgi:hypothetical protein